MIAMFFAFFCVLDQRTKKKKDRHEQTSSMSFSAKKVKVCPYECPDFGRFGTCPHEQIVRRPKPSPTVNRRRGSLPGIWSTLVSISSSPKGGNPAPSTEEPNQLQLSMVSKVEDDFLKSYSTKIWTLNKADDDLLNVHFELMLRDLAVPEKIHRELILNQSNEQKRRLLRVHALSRRPEMKTNLKDWVGAFANLRSNSISLHQLEELVVSLRTANRSSLEHFFFQS